MGEADAPPAGGGGRGRLLAAGALSVSLAAVVLVVLMRAERRPPELKPTLEHRASWASDVPTSCLVCHARNGPNPQPAGHTGRKDCADCHRLGG